MQQDNRSRITIFRAKSNKIIWRNSIVYRRNVLTDGIKQLYLSAFTEFQYIESRSTLILSMFNTLFNITPIYEKHMIYIQDINVYTITKTEFFFIECKLIDNKKTFYIDEKHNE